MKFWVYFDESENGVVSVIAVTRDTVRHLGYAADAVWAMDDHVISWHKDRFGRKGEPMSVHHYHIALALFLNDVLKQQIALSGTTKIAL